MKNLRFVTPTIAVLLTTASASALCAGLPCYPSPRFTLSATEVRDGKTGLTWQRGVAPVARTWADAKAYCPMVGANFRLPSVKELLTILDFTKTNTPPAIDTTAFPGTPALDFWTSSGEASGPYLAWFVNFADGGTFNAGVSNTYQVRCVR